MPHFAPYRQWVPVSSSNVEKIWYDPDSEILSIQFLAKGKQRARRYNYSGVPNQLWLDFLDAPSKGGFVHKHIRDRFVYTEV